MPPGGMDRSGVPRRQKGGVETCLAAGGLSCLAPGPRGLPAISRHQVDAGQVLGIPGRVAMHRESVEPAGHAGSVAAGVCGTAVGVPGGVRTEKPPGVNSPALHDGNADRWTNRAGRSRTVAIALLDQAYTSAVFAGNVRAPVPMLDGAGIPNCGSTVTGASQHPHLLTGIPWMLLLRFQEQTTIPRRKPTAR